MTTDHRAFTRTWPPIRSTPAGWRSQFWFYYTFNDFTDKHESDWEMAQVDFQPRAPQWHFERAR